nr:hypothetical protein StreXyl84_11930 [Streptomyces sp. Xyl84]
MTGLRVTGIGESCSRAASRLPARPTRVLPLDLGGRGQRPSARAPTGHTVRSVLVGFKLERDRRTGNGPVKARPVTPGAGNRDTPLWCDTRGHDVLTQKGERSCGWEC